MCYFTVPLVKPRNEVISSVIKCLNYIKKAKNLVPTGVLAVVLLSTSDHFSPAPFQCIMLFISSVSLINNFCS